MATGHDAGLMKTINSNPGVLVNLSDDEKGATIAAFCRVTPPEGHHLIHMITLRDGGRHGGGSTKPGNIVLNWKKLVSALPGICLTGAEAAASPWRIFLGCLEIWKKLYSTFHVELSPQQATAMLAMWCNCDNDKNISEARARSLTNEALVKFDMNQISEITFAKIIDDLSKTGCVEMSDGKIWLRERIKRRWP